MKKMLICILCTIGVLYTALIAFLIFNTGDGKTFSNPAKNREKISIMAPIIQESQKEAFNLIVSDKIAENADFTVDYFDFDDYYQNVEIAVSSGMYADIIIMPSSSFDSNLLSNEHIISINKVVKDNKMDEFAVTRNFSEKLSYDGELKGIAYDIFSAGVFYNKDIFEEYSLDFPSNYDELKSVIAVLRENGIIPFAVNCDGAGTYLFDYLASDVCGRTENLSEKDYEDITQKVSELYDMGAFPENFSELDNYDARALFTEGKAAMIVEDTSFCRTMNEIYNAAKGEGTKFGMEFFPWLGGGFGEEMRFMYDVGNYIILFTDKAVQSKSRAKMVSAFADHIFKEDVASAFFSETYGISTIKTLRPTPYFSSLMIDCFNLQSAAQFYISPMKNSEKKVLSEKISAYFAPHSENTAPEGIR